MAKGKKIATGTEGTTTVSIDAHQRVTERILADLERGVTPWTRPWSAEALAGRVTRPLRATGEPYGGINVILLWMEAVAHGYASPSWMTYKQALGGQVRRGETGAPVVYYGTATKRAEDAGSGTGTGEMFEGEEGREVRFLKSYTVFNVAQIDGLPDRFHAVPAEAPTLPACERVDAAEAWFAAIGATVEHGGTKAYYAAGADRIQLPPFEAFRDAHGYYATRGHETVHNAVIRIMPHSGQVPSRSACLH